MILRRYPARILRSLAKVDVGRHKRLTTHSPECCGSHLALQLILDFSDVVEGRGEIADSGRLDDGHYQDASDMLDKDVRPQPGNGWGNASF